MLAGTSFAEMDDGFWRCRSKGYGAAANDIPHRLLRKPGCAINRDVLVAEFWQASGRRASGRVPDMSDLSSLWQTAVRH